MPCGGIDSESFAFASLASFETLLWIGGLCNNEATSPARCFGIFLNHENMDNDYLDFKNHKWKCIHTIWSIRINDCIGIVVN